MLSVPEEEEDILGKIGAPIRLLCTVSGASFTLRLKSTQTRTGSHAM